MFRFIKSEFGRNVARMIGGTGLAQGINFLAALLLARLYTEADFGRLALFTSLMMLLVNIAGLRYELAIVLPAKKKKAFQILGLALGLHVFFAVAALFLLIFFWQNILSLLNSEALGNWVFLVPLGIFLLSAFNSLNYWYTRQKQFSFVAGVQVSQTIVGVLAQVGLSFVFPAFGLILGFLLRLASGFLLFLRGFLPEWPAFKPTITQENLKHTAQEYREFPLVNAPHVGVDILQNEGIIFLLLYFFTTALVGSYAFALRVIKAPLAIIGKALAPVFYQKANELSQQNDQQLQVLVKKIYLRLFLVGLPGFALLFIFAPALFAFLFGENWREAGQISRILAPWLFLNFLASPIAQLPLILNRQKQALLLAILGLIFKLGGLLLAGLTGASGAVAFLYLCVGGGIYQGLVVGWYYWIAGKGKKDKKDFNL